MLLGKEEYSKFLPYRELTHSFLEGSPQITCAEIKFISHESGIIALFAATKITELYKADDMATNQLVYMVFHSGEYELYDLKTKSRIKTQPSPFETLVIEYFTTGNGKDWISENIVFSGTLDIHSADSVLKQVSKLNAWDVIFNLTPLEESVLLKDTVAGNGGKKGYAAGQKEADKLNDRKLFLLKNLGITDDITLYEAAVFLQTEEGGSYKPKSNPIDIAIELLDSLVV
jgi:hypothetical protein